MEHAGREHRELSRHRRKHKHHHKHKHDHKHHHDGHDESGSGGSSELEIKDKDASKRDFVLSSESEVLQEKVMALLREETPTRKVVCVQFYVNRIFKINDVEQSTAVDLYLKLNWRSEKWIGKTDDDFQADEEHLEKDWWKSGVEVTNAIHLRKETDEEEAYWLEFPKYGILAYTQRYIGKLYTPMDLHQFPFDQQKLMITFESFHWKESDMKLVRLPTHAMQYPSIAGWTTMGSDFQLTEWNIESIQVDERTKRYAFEDRSYSQIYVTINLRRKFGFYIYKVIGILVMIVVMSWACFGMDPLTFSNRTISSVTLFLAAVAFNFMINNALPKVSYNTSLDEYLLVCYLLIAITVLQNLLSYDFYAKLPNHALSLAFDKWSAVAFAAVFILYNAYYFIKVGVVETMRKRSVRKKELR